MRDSVLWRVTGTIGATSLTRWDFLLWYISYEPLGFRLVELQHHHHVQGVFVRQVFVSMVLDNTMLHIVTKKPPSVAWINSMLSPYMAIPKTLLVSPSCSASSWQPVLKTWEGLCHHCVL